MELQNSTTLILHKYLWVYNLRDFLMCVRIGKSTQEGFSCVVSHAGVATLVPYGYRLYSVFFFDSV